MTEVQPNNSNNKNGIWILVSLLAIISTAILAWMYANESAAYSECKIANAQLKSEHDEMENALSGYIDETTQNLKVDFQQMLNAYDQMIAKDESMTDSLNLQKQKIEDLLQELSDTRRRSYREINNLKDENATLRVIMKDYLYRIDSLNTLNINLTSQLDETTTKLTKTATERDQLKEEQQRNQELLAQGARLSAFNFNSVALRYRMSGTTTEVRRANRVDVLSSTFSIGENSIAKTGNKTIYMQITDPNGKVITSRPSNILNVGGVEIIYTDEREINYQGQQIDVNIVHNLQGRDIDKGNYTVKIFADGALIGKDSFTLK